MATDRPLAVCCPLSSSLRQMLATPGASASNGRGPSRLTVSAALVVLMTVFLLVLGMSYGGADGVGGALRRWRLGTISHIRGTLGGGGGSPRAPEEDELPVDADHFVAPYPRTDYQVSFDVRPVPRAFAPLHNRTGPLSAPSPAKVAARLLDASPQRAVAYEWPTDVPHFPESGGGDDLLETTVHCHGRALDNRTCAFQGLCYDFASDGGRPHGGWTVFDPQRRFSSTADIGVRLNGVRDQGQGDWAPDRLVHDRPPPSRRASDAVWLDAPTVLMARHSPSNWAHAMQDDLFGLYWLLRTHFYRRPTHAQRDERMFRRRMRDNDPFVEASAAAAAAFAAAAASRASAAANGTTTATALMDSTGSARALTAAALGWSMPSDATVILLDEHSSNRDLFTFRDFDLFARQVVQGRLRPEAKWDDGRVAAGLPLLIKYGQDAGHWPGKTHAIRNKDPIDAYNPTAQGQRWLCFRRLAAGMPAMTLQRNEGYAQGSSRVYKSDGDVLDGRHYVTHAREYVDFLLGRYGLPPRPIPFVRTAPNEAAAGATLAERYGLKPMTTGGLPRLPSDWTTVEGAESAGHTPAGWRLPPVREGRVPLSLSAPSIRSVRDVTVVIAQRPLHRRIINAAQLEAALLASFPGLHVSIVAFEKFGPAAAQAALMGSHVPSTVRPDGQSGASPVVLPEGRTVALVVGIHGAQLWNTAFLPPGTGLIEAIPDTIGEFWRLYKWMARTAGLYHDYLLIGQEHTHPLGNARPGATIFRDYHLPIDDVVRAVRRAFRFMRILPADGASDFPVADDSAADGVNDGPEPWRERVVW
jgi:hypothetical protein